MARPLGDSSSLVVCLLVVSPDTVVQHALRRCGRLLGHVALTAADAMDARRWLARAQVDVLCVDSVLRSDEIEALCSAQPTSADGRRARVLYVGPPSAKLAPSILPRTLRERIDAYVTKPIELAEVSYELQRLLSGVTTRKRRDGLIRVEGTTLDTSRHELHFADAAAISLTPLESKLLRCLMEQAGEYVSKAELLEQVWGYPPDGGSELIRAHVSNLRRKLRGAGQDGLLRTMPYHGYAFMPDEGSPGPA